MCRHSALLLAGSANQAAAARGCGPGCLLDLSALEGRLTSALCPAASVPALKAVGFGCCAPLPETESRPAQSLVVTQRCLVYLKDMPRTGEGHG